MLFCPVGAYVPCFVFSLGTRMESAKVPGPKVFCRADKNEEEARGWYGLRPDVLVTK